MKGKTKITGNKGEDQAAAFLMQKGYRIIAKNYRHKRGEIDLIARIKDIYVFVEVKTRKNMHYGPPEAFVTKAQQKQILAVADEFTFQHQWEGMIRFDIISIIPGQEIVHIEDAFY